MPEANLTWIYKIYDAPDAALHQASGKTFEEAIKPFEIQGFKPILVRKEWAKYVWPGGYPMYYVTQDCGCLCANCANGNIDKTIGDDPQWKITCSDINWEDPSLYCDNCANFIESAYGETSDQLQEFINPEGEE